MKTYHIRTPSGGVLDIPAGRSVRIESGLYCFDITITEDNELEVRGVPNDFPEGENLVMSTLVIAPECSNKIAISRKKIPLPNPQ